jgi:hypothetical protein
MRKQVFAEVARLATTLVLLYLYFGWHNHNKENRHGRRHESTERA